MNKNTENTFENTPKEADKSPETAHEELETNQEIHSAQGEVSKEVTETLEYDPRFDTKEEIVYVFENTVSEPDFAVSEPDFAVSEPDFTDEKPEPTIYL